MTSIDTIYEYSGFKLAGSLSALLSGVGLPLIVALAGVAYTVHSMADRGSIRDLGVYVLYLILAAWLLGTTLQQGVASPRFIVYTGQAADLLQKRAIRTVNERFLTAPYEWERIAARVASGRIYDPVLDRDVAAFLSGCGRTTLARAEPRQPNLLRDGALPYEGACEDRRKELWQRLLAHVRKDPHHQATLAAGGAKDPSKAAAFLERYADEIVIRAIDEPGSPTSEASLVAASIGDSSATDPSQSTGPLPSWLKAFGGPLGVLFGDEAANATLTGLAEVHQDYENRWMAKQKYYLVVTFGPHVYGLSLMILLGLFPVVGLFSLLPGKWRVLVHYGKTLVSVKLWPVGWAVLSSFNARRGTLEAFEPPERASGTSFLAIAAMYLVVPALSFLLVQLATAAAAMPFAPAVPPPAGPGTGPAAPAVRVAARLAK